MRPTRSREPGGSPLRTPHGIATPTRLTSAGDVDRKPSAHAPSAPECTCRWRPHSALSHSRTA
eukprot:7250501-Prorocentrum_lima.AAC.1